MNLVNDLTVDFYCACGDFFQTGQHSQGGGFSAARRPDQHYKFPVFDFQIEILNRDGVSKVFSDLMKFDVGHSNRFRLIVRFLDSNLINGNRIGGTVFTIEAEMPKKNWVLSFLVGSTFCDFLKTQTDSDLTHLMTGCRRARARIRKALLSKRVSG
jgi:hypothetical protein